MKPFTFNQKRIVAGIYLAVLLFAVGNEYLEWGVFGGSAKPFRVIVMFVGLLALLRFGPKLFREVDAHEAAKRKAEEAAELTRDKSTDVAETERLRRDIGMPPDTSMERPHGE